jgi:anti-sigma28 factor (negative regulator of flagellin synthesis)
MEVNSLGPINNGQPIRRVPKPVAQPQTSQPQPSQPRPAQAGEKLQLSPTAAAESLKIDQASNFTSLRIEQIQQQIADGTYETGQKLSGAIDRLMPELTAE